MQVERDRLDLQLASLDFPEVQHVVQEFHQRVSGELDLAKVVLLLRRQFSVQGRLRQADDGVHRCANLMAHLVQEVAPRPALENVADVDTK